jgi:hypothetical protein
MDEDCISALYLCASHVLAGGDITPARCCQQAWHRAPTVWNQLTGRIFYSEEILASSRVPGTSRLQPDAAAGRAAHSNRAVCGQRQ